MNNHVVHLSMSRFIKVFFYYYFTFVKIKCIVVLKRNLEVFPTNLMHFAYNTNMINTDDDNAVRDISMMLY